MGSGTSKDNAVDAFEVSDDEEKSKKEDNKNSEKQTNKLKGISVLGPMFGKPKAKATTNITKARTIVNLNSSEREDEYLQHKAEKDEELKDDINSLEKTLSSLGLEERVRKVRVNESRKTRPPTYSSHSDGQKRLPGRRRKDLRFSWDDRQEERKMEEWTVNKVRTGQVK